MRPAIASTATTIFPGGEREGHRDDGEAADRRGGSPTGRGNAGRPAKTGPQGDPGLTLAGAARDYIWLYDFRHGIGHRKIAVRDRVSVRQVRDGIERARALEAMIAKDNPIEHLKPGRADEIHFRLTPLFPIASFTPQSTCPHHKSIGRGSTFCCMVCHASGMDDHPGLRRDPQTDPSPEPEPAPAPGAAEPDATGDPRETRKQRRRRQFADAAAVA